MDHIRRLIDARDVAGLILLLETGNEEEQHTAALNLGRWQATEAVEPLRRALANRSWLVRYASAEALGALGIEAAEPALEELNRLLRQEEDGRVKEQVLLALQRLGAF